jgi:hypothetical protein
MDPENAVTDAEGRTDYSRCEGTGMFLTVTPKEGSAYKREMRRRFNEMRQREIAEQAGAKAAVQTIEDIIGDTIEILAACTVGWRGVVIDEAEGELPYTPDNVRRLYALEFVRQQADAQIMGVTGFTKG